MVVSRPALQHSAVWISAFSLLAPPPSLWKFQWVKTCCPFRRDAQICLGMYRPLQVGCVARPSAGKNFSTRTWTTDMPTSSPCTQTCTCVRLRDYDFKSSRCFVSVLLLFYVFNVTFSMGENHKCLVEQNRCPIVLWGNHCNNSRGLHLHSLKTHHVMFTVMQEERVYHIRVQQLCTCNNLFTCLVS